MQLLIGLAAVIAILAVGVALMMYADKREQRSRRY
jgi:hypothetical protein